MQPTDLIDNLSKRDDIPDYWFEPERSVVLELTAFEIITPSESFLPANYTRSAAEMRNADAYSPTSTSHDTWSAVFRRIAAVVHRIRSPCIHATRRVHCTRPHARSQLPVLKL